MRLTNLHLCLVCFFTLSLLFGRDETTITRQFTVYEPAKTNFLRAVPTITSSQKLLETTQLSNEQQNGILAIFNQLIKSASLTPICNGDNYLLLPTYHTNEQGVKKQIGYNAHLRFQCIFKRDEKDKFDFFIQEIDKIVSKTPLLTFTPPSVSIYLNKQETHVLQDTGYNHLITLALSKVKHYSQLLNKKCYLRSIDLIPLPSYQDQSQKQFADGEQPISAAATYSCD